MPKSETATFSLSRAIAIVALILAALYFAFALLAIFPAPTYRLWQLAILATELGHVLWLLGIPFLVGFRFKGTARTATWLALAGSLLLLTPALRSLVGMRQLPRPLAVLRREQRFPPERLMRSPQFRFPAQLADVRAAIDYLKRRADSLGFDSTHIVLYREASPAAASHT